MTNAEILEHGRKLFQSAENLRRSAPELDALLESLWEILENEELFEKITDLGDETSGGNEKWVASAYAYNAGILSRPARAPGPKGRLKDPKQIGTISIIVRLCDSKNSDGELPDWPWLDQACLIVGWHPKQKPNDPWVWKIENFDPDDENQESIVPVGDGLWAWREGDGDDAYFFVLPIFALTNEDALKRFALRPVKALFYADDPKTVAEVALRDVPVLLPPSK